MTNGGTTTIEFLFYPNMINIGEKFNVCVTVVSTKQIECTSGINRSVSEPEYITINMPNTGNSPNTGSTRGINWGAICKSFDNLIVEPCETLTTPDGYTLTSVGQRVFLVCIGGSGLAAALGHSELIAPLGSAARCGGSSSTDNGLGNLLQSLIAK